LAFERKKYSAADLFSFLRGGERQSVEKIIRAGALFGGRQPSRGKEKTLGFHFLVFVR
jgi:hypothetical protein